LRKETLVKSPEYFINPAIWAVVAILLGWGVSAGTLSRFDAALIASIVAWPFAAFYCFRFEGLVGLLMKLYVVAPLVIFPLWYFGLL
jgi:hypothetical protein